MRGLRVISLPSRARTKILVHEIKRLREQADLEFIPVSDSSSENLSISTLCLLYRTTPTNQE